MPYFTAEVYFDPEDMTDDEILEEYERRNLGTNPDVDAVRKVLGRIHDLRSQGRNYTSELDDLIYQVLGRVQ
jgi:hypothetical protein